MASLLFTFPNTFGAKLTWLFLLIALGDFLFLDHGLGLNLAIFSAVLAVFVNACHWSTRHAQTNVATYIFVALSVIAVVENISWISILLLVVSVTTLVLRLNTIWFSNTLGWLISGLQFYLLGPIRFISDIEAIQKLRKRRAKRVPKISYLSWTIPIVLTAVFAFLLSLANPMIERWIEFMFSTDTPSSLSAKRLFLWVGIALMVWPLLAARMKAKKLNTVAKNQGDLESSTNFFKRVLSRQTVTRSLVLFNVLFGFETVLDITYLWAGAALPAGMSYAAYAHRGAYMLLFTVLMAAIFVLLTMYNGSPHEKNKTIRALVYLWIGQNIFLTFSSIERLRLYIDTYSLTHWRIAALVWMGLVALGLAIILWRIFAKRGNLWLINANVLSALAVLIICSFVNFGSIIARENVGMNTKTGLLGETRACIDVDYIQSLGTAAIPALIHLQSKKPTVRCLGGNKLHLKRTISKLRQRLDDQNRNWRTFSYRHYRLAKTLQSLQNYNTNTPKQAGPND